MVALSFAALGKAAPGEQAPKPASVPGPTPLDLSIVMPCLNEARTLQGCIVEARAFLEASGLNGEIVVADNGSTDGSPFIAESLGARVVHVAERGYGSALRAAIRAARGTYVAMGDSDGSYDFKDLSRFVDALDAGSDVVLGNRFKGGIAPKAMPFLHRYLGNPVLSALGRLFFGTGVGDFHCGLRAFRRAAVDALDLRTVGMEFATEMVAKAALAGLAVTEVPTSLRPDGRDRPSHLRTWRDGWRHLRFMLLCSPRWLFLYPGLAASCLGLLLMLALLPAPQVLGAVVFDVHTLVAAMGLLVVGAQVTLSFAVAQRHAVRRRLRPGDAVTALIERHLTPGRLLVLGPVLFAGGFALLAWVAFGWTAAAFPDLDSAVTLRLVVPAVAAMALGAQFAAGGFLLSALDLDQPEAGRRQAM